MGDWGAESERQMERDGWRRGRKKKGIGPRCERGKREGRSRVGGEGETERGHTGTPAVLCL